MTSARIQFLSLCLGGIVASAAPISWDGSFDSDWNTPANWTPEALPTAIDDVTIQNNASVAATSPNDVNSLSIGEDGSTTSLSLHNSSQVIADRMGLGANSKLTLTGSHLSIGGDFDADGTVEFKLAGTTRAAPAQTNNVYAAIDVAGDVNFLDEVSLALHNGFTPSPGDRFEIMKMVSSDDSLETATVTMPNPGPWAWRIEEPADYQLVAAFAPSNGILWDGELDSNFHTPQNWHDDVAPTALDSADVAGGAIAIATANVNLDTLRVGTETGDGSLTVLDQSVHLTGNLEIADVDWNADRDLAGHFTMLGDGTQQLAIDGALYIGKFSGDTAVNDVTASFVVENLDSVTIARESELAGDTEKVGSHVIDFVVNNVREVTTHNIDLDHGRGQDGTYAANLRFSNIDKLQIRDLAWESIEPHANLSIDVMIDTVQDASIAKVNPGSLSFSGTEKHVSQSAISITDSTVTINSRFGNTDSGKTVRPQDTAEIQSSQSLTLTDSNLTFNSNTFTMAVIGGGGTNAASTYNGSVSLLNSTFRHDGTAVRFGNHYDDTAGTYTADWSMINSVAVIANEFTFGQVSGVGTLDATLSMNPSYLQVGTLNLGDAAHLILTLEGNTRATEAGVLAGDPDLYSAIDVLGAGNLDGTLEVQLGGGFTPTVGDTFTLINAGAFTGGFDSFLFPTGFNWTLTQNATDLFVTYNGAAIPEPGTIILFLTLIGLTATYSRKSRPAQTESTIQIR